MPPTVRVAGSRDLDALLLLVEQFQECERIPFDAEAARQHLAHLLEDPRLGQVLLAEQSDAAIGYAILTYGYDLEFGGMDAYLTDLFLVEIERDRGVGTWLLGKVEESARTAGVQALHLMVAPANQRAHHVYYRAGFRASPRLFLTKLLTE
ncbi:MAG TPA: GNAT family N-acetyltransferase [Kofleriaceae bacterium]|nr:GNAT family N-acetyltransferase [Kofleriaceae bacterium]